jgi:signal transduction histidine kinase
MAVNWYLVRRPFSGEGNQLIGICRDITELSQAYNGLALEHEWAQAADRAKTDFLTNMSHEIRTPVKGIIGLLDVLAMHKLTVEQRLLTDVIRSSLFELMKQLSQTLNMQQIERGTIDINNEIFGVSKSLEAVAVAAATRARTAISN